MDDSDQDFSFLCSRLLKRVRRKGGGSGDEKKPGVKGEGDGDDSGSQSHSRSKAPCKRKREKGGVLSKTSDRSSNDGLVNGGSEVGRGEQKEQKMRAKEMVLRRMQRFKRATPPRLVHTGAEASTESSVLPAETQSLPTQGPVENQESDELLAQGLQQQMDREAEGQAVVDDGGLFFCQLCYKDLSVMSHQLRTQHINRCLDARENIITSRAPPPRPLPRPRVPECPICGRGFKSEKSRSTHLKRCSASMGVSPAELLQALQRQAAERDNGQQTGGSSDTSESTVPVRKKARRKVQHMDEATMVALALSRSLLEQEKERERDREEERRIRSQLSDGTSVTAPVVQAGAGKIRVKRRKGAPDAPPPLLLVQDPQAAQNRIQERVSSLLLVPRPPSPPTPTLLPTALSTHTLLWLKTALPGGGPALLSEFYTAELGAFIQPWSSAQKKASDVTPVKCPAAASESATPLVEHQAPRRPSTSVLGTPGTQALTDLVDLAEEGMTLTQYRYADNNPAEAEPQQDLSGFVPKTLQPLPVHSTSVLKLSSDLGSMVNNPQLSDVQLQVDTGDVYFAHSFMLYTRCPLLANMVHDAGFGVLEEGFPQAQRVLVNDVSGEAVYVLLQYLYTAVCRLTHTLLPDVLQLASRYGLSELQELCEQYTGNPEEDLREQGRDASSGHEPATPAAEPQQSLADSQFLALLRSMWEHDDDDDEEEAKRGTEGSDEEDSRDGEIRDDLVDEDELNEIYEFAATQRMMGAKAEVSTESGGEDEAEGVKNCAESIERDQGQQNEEAADQGKQNEEETDLHRSADGDLNPVSNKNTSQSRDPDASLDRSYNRLFSESWGEYVEVSQIQRLDQKNIPTSRRTSSFSEVIDLSVSPLPECGETAEPVFPVTGSSPGEGSRKIPDQTEAVQQALMTSESPSHHKISRLTTESSKIESKHPSGSTLQESPTVPGRIKPKLSPSKPSRNQPELIVLSDSSDDMDPDLPDEGPSRRDAPRPSTSSPSRLGLRYTHIKKKEKVGDSPKKSIETTESSRLDQEGSVNVLDGSAEVSWLIPATPERSLRTSSTQTSSSMRRIQLFPRPQSSSSSSLSDNSKVTPCSDSHKEPHKERSQASPAFPEAHIHSRLSKTSRSDSVNLTYSNSANAPCSSTPLHSDPRLQRLDPLGSPLPRDGKPRTQRRAGLDGRHVSVHLSPSENSSSPRHSSQLEKELSKPPQLCEYPGDEEMNTEEKELMEASKRNDAEVIKEGFSFVFDEPPIAFSDSWDLGGPGPEQGPCFSLRLETSEDQTSPSEQCRQVETASLHASCPPAHGDRPDLGAPHDHSLPDAAMWDSWKEDDSEEEVDALPLSQRVSAVPVAKRVSQLRTPVLCKKKPQAPLVPITPMPSFSDMDTPDLKNKLNRYGVRPLPKKQMVLKLKEIHQYTHQVMSSGSDDEASPRSRPRAAPAVFKEPTAHPPVSPRKLQFIEEEQDTLPASQESNTSSTAESERSNPELCESEDDGSDGEDITASQAAVREKDKLQAVRSFILADPVLYSRVLQYQPLSLSELKAGLRTAGIRLGTTKLLDFLDSQCITFTTAKQGHPAPSRRRAGRGRKQLAKVVA